MLTTARIITAVSLLVTAAQARCPDDWRLESTYRDASGRKLCVRHHVPLVTVRGFEMPQPWPTIDPATDEEGQFELCNPNRIIDYYSLRRTRVISKPCRITYCTRCEAAVHAWRLRNWKGYGSDDSGGSWQTAR